MLHDFIFKVYFILSENVINEKRIYCNILLTLRWSRLFAQRRWSRGEGRAARVFSNAALPNHILI